jgi:hypothetical protein
MKLEVLFVSPNITVDLLRSFLKPPTMQSGNGYGSTNSAGIRNSSFIAGFVSSRKDNEGEPSPPCVNLFFANQQCGQLVSSAYSPTFRKTVGFAYVEPYLASTGVELLCYDATRITIKGRIDAGISSCDRP